MLSTMLKLTRVVVVSCWLVLISGCATTKYDNVEGTSTQKGVRYLLGRGVAQNNTKAFYYFKKAAHEENNLYAQNELAYLYAAGKGIRKDYTKALYYYEKAAIRGLASAQYNLGMMYFHGLGTAENKQLARKWFEKAAALGFEPARVVLEQA